MAKKTTSSSKKVTKKVTIKKINAGSKPKAPKAWKNNIASPKAYTPGTYTSEYTDKINSALDTVTNWNYDPMQDASYQAMARVYNQRGNLAAKNSLADAAALNGGYGTSYAVSAAQQARNQYNQELASMIPDFENAAYNRATNTLAAWRDADDTAYGRFRDTESDRQWKYSQDYTAYRDKVGDSQWAWTQNYNKWRDLQSDWQWLQNWNMDVQQWEESKKASSGGGGGGGGRRSSGGGGGGYSGGSGSGSGSGLTNKIITQTPKDDTNLQQAARRGMNTNKTVTKTTTPKKKKTSATGSYHGGGYIKNGKW